MAEFWETAFRKMQLAWGLEPTVSAGLAAERFAAAGARDVLIPGIGYGRNARPFLDRGMAVTGIEIAETAIALARDGLPTPWFLAGRAPEVLPRLPSDPAYQPLRDLLAPGGANRAWGDPLVRPALARTLAAVAADPGAFYRGSIADDIVATAAAAGGVITAADLAGYQVAERAPLVGTWRGLRLATVPLPSSGGVVLLEALGILDRTRIDLAAMGQGTAASLHVIAELEKHGFADRARLLGDSDAARALSLIHI